jgi:hypothetical protein
MADVKNDMNRMGLFSEMQYVTIGDEYVPSSKCKQNYWKIQLSNSQIYLFKLVLMRLHIRANKCCQVV